MSNERFRNELLTNLSDVLDNAQLAMVLKVFDTTSSAYEIEHKATELAVIGETPEPVKWYIASKAVANLSKGTLKQYSYKLIDFFDNVKKPVQAITANDIRLYLYSFKQDHSASDHYLETIRITLNGFFKWLVNNDYIARNPCDKIERIKYQPAKRESLTPYELEKFRWEFNNIREKALIDFLYSTGCRVSECAAVMLTDIDWKSRSVQIQHGKGDKARTVYFNAESELSLRNYINTRDDDTPALWVSERKPHKQITAHALELIIQKVSKRAGLHVYPHKLRHTFATAGLRGGIPLPKLQDLMGHARPETTMIYVDQAQDEIRMEHQRVFA